MALLIKVLRILLAIAVVVLCYFIAVWVLGLLGIRPPEEILKVIFVILGLMALIGALTGKFDNFI